MLGLALEPRTTQKEYTGEQQKKSRRNHDEGHKHRAPQSLKRDTDHNSGDKGEHDQQAQKPQAESKTTKLRLSGLVRP